MEGCWWHRSSVHAWCCLARRFFFLRCITLLCTYVQDPGNVQRIFNVVRGMVICASMTAVASAVCAFAEVCSWFSGRCLYFHVLLPVRQCVRACDVTFDIECAHVPWLTSTCPRHLFQHPRVVIARSKERFLEQPSEGGWRDFLLCFYIVGDANKHI